MVANTKSINKNEDFQKCRDVTFPILESMGLKLDLDPTPNMLTTPTEFDTLFPGSAGSLYGRSPHGINSTFKRPLAQNSIKGLWMAGGGIHPGPGVPMALSSGKHAAEMMLKDLSLI